MENADKAAYDQAISHIYSGRATGLVTRVKPGTRNLAPKFPRPSEKRQPRPPRPRSAWRQAGIAVLALVLCVTLGVFGADEFLIHRDNVAAVKAASARSLYVGSILFYPDTGNRCHQLYFDNRDGHFADNGAVDCTRAAAEATTKDTSKASSAARTESISKGFH
jgi:hypothetical protein